MREVLRSLLEAGNASAKHIQCKLFIFVYFPLEIFKKKQIVQKVMNVFECSKEMLTMPRFSVL